MVKRTLLTQRSSPEKRNKHLLRPTKKRQCRREADTAVIDEAGEDIVAAEVVTEVTDMTTGIVGSTETVTQPSDASRVTKPDTKRITAHRKKTKKEN